MEKINEMGKKIDYHFLGENKGIAYALNFACKNALKENFEWILTMDQDSKFEQNNLKEMFDKFLKIPNIDGIGIVSPVHQYIENKKYKNSTSGQLYKEIEATMTSGNLLNLEIWCKLNGFKEEFFIDEVDHEYCLRLKKYGFKVIQIKNVFLKHHLGRSRTYRFLWKKKVVTHHSPLRRYYITRNRLFMIKLYPYLIKSYTENIVEDFFKILLYEKEKKLKIKMMFYGVSDYLKGKNGKKV